MKQVRIVERPGSLTAKASVRSPSQNQASLREPAEPGKGVVELHLEEHQAHRMMGT